MTSVPYSSECRSRREEALVIPPPHHPLSFVGSFVGNFVELNFIPSSDLRGERTIPSSTTFPTKFPTKGEKGLPR